MPIEYLDLELRNEDRLAADVIAHMSGPATTDIITRQIEARREFLKLIEAGLDTPLCPELTNANPGSAHTVIAEAIVWALAQQAHRINQIPKQNLIAFGNLFGIEPRPATAGTTTLRFTIDAPTNETVVTIPIGTEVSDEIGDYVFVTTEVGTRTGDGTVDVAATRSITGPTLLSANVLTELISVPAHVTGVTNPHAIDSGSDIEPLNETLERVRRYQRRGERIVTARDLEEAILDEGMLGNGIVRVFPFVTNGDFVSGTKTPGHTTAVVMTRTGEVIDTTTANRIAALLEQVVGNQFVYVVNPSFVEFGISFSVRLVAGALETAVVASIETNLRNFYAAARERFGAPIYRSEIIAVVEGTAGVDRIESDGVNILAAPLVDTRLKEYEIAKLEEVTIEVV